MDYYNENTPFEIEAELVEPVAIPEPVVFQDGTGKVLVTFPELSGQVPFTVSGTYRVGFDGRKWDILPEFVEGFFGACEAFSKEAHWDIEAQLEATGRPSIDSDKCHVTLQVEDCNGGYTRWDIGDVSLDTSAPARPISVRVISAEAGKDYVEVEVVTPNREDGVEVEAAFNGKSFGEPVTSFDQDGVAILRVPAGQTLTGASYVNGLRARMRDGVGHKSEWTHATRMGAVTPFKPNKPKAKKVDGGYVIIPVSYYKEDPLVPYALEITKGNATYYLSPDGRRSVRPVFMLPSEWESVVFYKDAPFKVRAVAMHTFNVSVKSEKSQPLKVKG